MIFSIIDSLIYLWFKLKAIRKFIKYSFIFGLTYYLSIVFLIYHKTNYIVGNPQIIFSKEAFEFCAQNYAIYLFLFLIIYIIFTLSAFASIIKALNANGNKEKTISLEEVAKYWLNEEEIQGIKRETTEVKFSIMNAKDTHIYAFANMTFKPLIEEKNITYDESLIIAALLEFLQDYAKLAPSVSSFKTDPNYNYKKSQFTSTLSYYDVYKAISLLDHSLHAAKIISEDENIKSNFRIGLAIIAALAHDIGKIDFATLNLTFTKNNSFIKLITNKPHFEVSKHALDAMIGEKLCLNDETLKELELVYEAIQLHHNAAVDKDKLNENIIIAALRNADKLARKKELDLFAKNQIRTLDSMQMANDDKTSEKESNENECDELDKQAMRSFASLGLVPTDEIKKESETVIISDEENEVNQNGNANELTQLFNEFYGTKSANVIIVINGQSDLIQNALNNECKIAYFNQIECIFNNAKYANSSMRKLSKTASDLKVLILNLNDFANFDEFIIKAEVLLEDTSLYQAVTVYKKEPIQTFLPQEQRVKEVKNIDFSQDYEALMQELAKYINTYSQSNIYSITYKDCVLFEEKKFKNIIAKYYKLADEEVEPYSNAFVSYLDELKQLKYINTKKNYFAFNFSIIQNKNQYSFSAISVLIKAFNLDISELNKQAKQDQFLNKIIIKEG